VKPAPLPQPGRASRANGPVFIPAWGNACAYLPENHGFGGVWRGRSAILGAGFLPPVGENQLIIRHNMQKADMQNGLSCPFLFPGGCAPVYLICQKALNDALQYQALPFAQPVNVPM
jgi:hypothetical protein